MEETRNGCRRLSRCWFYFLWLWIKFPPILRLTDACSAWQGWPRGMVKAAEQEGDTHGKLVLGVDSPPAHRPRVVEPLHVVGFVKAARQEEAEAPCGC